MSLGAWLWELCLCPFVCCTEVSRPQSSELFLSASCGLTSRRPPPQCFQSLQKAHGCYLCRNSATVGHTQGHTSISPLPDSCQSKRTLYVPVCSWNLSTGKFLICAATKCPMRSARCLWLMCVPLSCTDSQIRILKVCSMGLKCFACFFRSYHGTGHLHPQCIPACDFAPRL